jgi:alditol oxidase
MDSERRNWAGNYTYRAVAVRYPQTVREVQAAVKDAGTIRALGTRHSFNAIADTSGEQLCLDKLDKILGINAQRMTVTLEAGARYGHLARYLHDRGYALPNLASLPHISVAGACATATHGSGDHNGNLATAVVGLELVAGDGQVVMLSRENRGDAFAGMVVALGALGIVTKLTLKIIPTFTIRQWVYENLPFTAIETHFDEIFSSAHSVSMFTDWQHGRICQVWRKCLANSVDKAEPSETFFGATLAPTDRHPITAISPENCTPQGGVPGPWHERLPHFKLGFTPSSGEELQSEYFVPRPNAVAALKAVFDLRDQITPNLHISEIRTIAADGLWMSPCYRQPSVGIHFTWKPDWPAVQEVLPQIEEKLIPLGARPHWGKLFTMSPARIASSYEKLSDFRALAEQFDPKGKFRNDFVSKFVFTPGLSSVMQ